jgi:hypothetical protein
MQYTAFVKRVSSSGRCEMPLNFFTSSLRLSDAIFSDARAGIRRQPNESGVSLLEKKAPQ